MYIPYLAYLLIHGGHLSLPLVAVENNAAVNVGVQRSETLFFLAVPMAWGSSWARDQTQTTAVTKPDLLTTRPSGIEPASSQRQCQVLTC